MLVNRHNRLLLIIHYFCASSTTPLCSFIPHDLCIITTFFLGLNFLFLLCFRCHGQWQSGHEGEIIAAIIFPSAQLSPPRFFHSIVIAWNSCTMPTSIVRQRHTFAVYMGYLSGFDFIVSTALFIMCGDEVGAWQTRGAKKEVRRSWDANVDSS